MSPHADADCIWFFSLFFYGPFARKWGTQREQRGYMTKGSVRYDRVAVARLGDEDAHAANVVAHIGHGLGRESPVE